MWVCLGVAVHSTNCILSVSFFSCCSDFCSRLSECVTRLNVAGSPFFLYSLSLFFVVKSTIEVFWGTSLHASVAGNISQLYALSSGRRNFYQIFIRGPTNKRGKNGTPTLPPLPRQRLSGIYLQYLIWPHTLKLHKAEPHTPPTHPHTLAEDVKKGEAPGLIAAVLITVAPGRAICDPVF